MSYSHAARKDWARRHSKGYKGWRGQLATAAMLGIITVLYVHWATPERDVNQDLVPVALAFLAGSVLWPVAEFAFNYIRAPRGLDQEGINLLGDVLVTQRTKTGQLQTRLDEIEDGKPKVSLRVDGYNLAVINDGGRALFWARLIVLGAGNWPADLGTDFHALWQRTQGLDSAIGGGDYDRIVLGGFSPTKGTPPDRILTLHYFNVRKQVPSSLPQSYLREAQSDAKPWLRLELKIFSHPGPETPIIRLVELRWEGVILLP